MASGKEAEAEPHPFKGRSLCVIKDFNLHEQWYFYQKAHQLKEAIKSGASLDSFRLTDPEAAAYLIFMEDSTRTKESFRNAAEFHQMKVNVFDAKTSSFTKNETITDTIKMLCGYSIGQSTFIIRSKVEGVTKWLEKAIGDYTTSRGIARASFVNAGDGRHEHPSQELLDQFSFWDLQCKQEIEVNGPDWDPYRIPPVRIHLALVGDLLHGRTVHSKVDGLRIYRRVLVDLIAPPELALPKMYEDRMSFNGFKIRKFNSIAEYLEQPQVSRIWYFTRLQLERMGDKLLDKATELRAAVSFREEFLSRVPEGTKFFHPLPRDARDPELPFWLDNHPRNLNGWDEQSQNGYFVRIVLLGMLGGHLGSDFQYGADLPEPQSPMLGPEQPLTALGAAKDFIREVEREGAVQEEDHQSVGLGSIQKGIIIRNLAKGKSTDQIWTLMYVVRSVLGLSTVGGQGILKNAEGEASGFITVPDEDIETWGRQPLKKLAAVAPGSILLVIKDNAIWKEFNLEVPPRIYNFKDMSCKNNACVAHPNNMQHEVRQFFVRVPLTEFAELSDASAWAFACQYCEHRHSFWDIWDFK